MNRRGITQASTVPVEDPHGAWGSWFGSASQNPAVGTICPAPFATSNWVSRSSTARIESVFQLCLASTSSHLKNPQKSRCLRCRPILPNSFLNRFFGLGLWEDWELGMRFSERGEWERFGSAEVGVEVEGEVSRVKIRLWVWVWVIGSVW